ncbi:hypothetical protein Poli38472_005870 [Pythium oligandrum]|uniref:Tetraspanin n=1 Tax=Pythium oligandrum TaxID=41045 RepID=A0A8K1FQX4_PYTOL|nr:hypothetical protein Poli38472_005870 [Pythium oligandrum]|eukprot:TMW68402.1 hypothetical protein Poli38472_005870 [Pythium oligandrum]
MGCLSESSKICSTLLLIAINMLLLAGGVLVEYASIHLRNTGWLDVVEAYWSSADKLLLAMQIIGGILIGLAVLGSIAAICRWRFGLLIYSFVVSIMLILFAIIAVLAFIVRNKSENWKSQAYPAESDEEKVKTEFDRIYCYAQGAYICNSITVKDAATLFMPGIDSSILSQFGDAKGVSEICGTYLTLIPTIKPLCEACEVAKNADNITDVLDWANEKCPRTDSTMLWCGSYLVTGEAGSTGTAPYTQCRSEFLGLVSDTTLLIGAGGVLVAVGALLVIAFSCFLRRKERKEQNYDDLSYTPAHRQNHNVNTPETSQPIYSKV